MLPDEFDAKWTALRSRFIARLPERIADIELHWSACADGDRRDAFNTLFHVAHNLVGSGATFGFDELARAAREVETSIEAAMTATHPLASATTARMSEAVRRLACAAAAVVAASSTGGRP